MPWFVQVRGSNSYANFIWYHGLYRPLVNMTAAYTIPSVFHPLWCGAADVEAVDVLVVAARRVQPGELGDGVAQVAGRSGGSHEAVVDGVHLEHQVEPVEVHDLVPGGHEVAHQELEAIAAFLRGSAAGPG